MGSFLTRCALILTLSFAVVACDDNDQDLPTGTPPNPSPSASPEPSPPPPPAPSPTPEPTGGLEIFAGFIDQIVSSDTLIVGQRTVMADQNTKIMRKQAPITFSELQVGDDVVVKANQRGDGTWLASEIKVRPPE